ncbi:MAG: fused MFS/spermidine synthase [Anaerolineales bacterium]|nr:fused MFS/spermidine synthase [Anaerolineales bacterium]
MRWLYLLVFVAGLVTLGMELSASRLLEPAFGNSQIVWAALIGLILLSLAAGAWLGGLLADRYPHRSALELTLTAGALCVAFVPLLSTPVLRLASQGLAEFAPGLLIGALLAVGLLFAAPAMLLGTATPWAVRLAMEVNEQERATRSSSEKTHLPSNLRSWQDGGPPLRYGHRRQSDRGVSTRTLADPSLWHALDFLSAGVAVIGRNQRQRIPPVASLGSAGGNRHRVGGRLVSAAARCARRLG